MNLQLVEVMRQIERSRRVDREVLLEAIRAALISASRKSHGAAQDIQVVFDTEKGELYAIVKKTVVAEVTEPWREVSQEETRRLGVTAKLGDEVAIRMAPSEFGRIAAQTAKQVVVQRVRESERNAIFEEYQKRLGDLINGVVLRQEHRNLILDLGETEAILPGREQAPKEFYQVGDRVKCLIIDVRKTSRSPQVVVSRSHPNMIRSLFEMEVPEIADGVVEIKAIAREAGARTKIAVRSNDKNVDPVGACVGLKGSRVQAIVREIRGEKIDIIPYAEHVGTLLESALQPAKIAKVEMAPAGDQARVIVPDDQLSLAIGKNGQNVRLAAKLCNTRIDIMSESQHQEQLRKQAEAAFLQAAPSLETVEGIGAKLAERLAAAGYDTLASLRGQTVESLTQIPGVGPKTADKILTIVQSYLPSVEAPKRATTAAELFAGLGDESETRTVERVPEAGELFAGLDRQDDATEQQPSTPPVEEAGDPAPESQEEGDA